MEQHLPQTKNEISTEILTLLLECNSACADVNSFEWKKPSDDVDIVDFYLKVLPGAEYILQMLVNYLFSNGLTTGLVDEDAKLERFLYRTNEQDATNLSVLQDSVRFATAYGEAGVRWYEDNLYLVKPDTFFPLVATIDGITRPVAYVASKDGSRIGSKEVHLKDIEFKEQETITRSIERYFDNQDLLLLDRSDFRAVRNLTSDINGESPFLKDQLRLDLLVTAYERLIHDLNYEGPGRVLFWPKSGYVEDEVNELSTTTVLNQSAAAQTERTKKAQKALEEFAGQFKNSKTDSIGVVPSIFSDKYAHFPKVTKATEFFDWIENEGIIVSQVIGIPSDLLGLGRLSGNVSMEKIIDDAMLNKIIPMREKYAMQFSGLLSEKLGLSKVYFNKYELQQSEDENNMRTKIVNMMSLLNSMKDETDATRPEALELFNNLAEMLEANIHHENGDLKELHIAKKESNNEQNTINGRNPRPSQES